MLEHKEGWSVYAKSQGKCGNRKMHYDNKLKQINELLINKGQDNSFFQ